ncbi:MAG: pyridoxamine 5'-phosphate oxidase family protein [Candidatus Omnitrophica bacterium]|nr:pyridoxamine 5'-phosphate oxidase family protein [Candidatus Omnitrophota bacterium]
MNLSADIIHFFQSQGFLIVSTVDINGYPHSSCKGIVDIKPEGKIYLLDVYHGKTYENLKANPLISVTAVNEHKFSGFCLKGRAQIVSSEEMDADIHKAWEDRITGRLTQRLIKNLKEEKGHPLHPEAMLPQPKYLIVMDVDEIVDLTPGHLK